MNDITEIEKLKCEIISLKEIIEDLEAEIDSLQSENENLEEKVDELRDELAEKITELYTLFDWDGLTHVQKERVRKFAFEIRYEVKI